MHHNIIEVYYKTKYLTFRVGRALTFGLICWEGKISKQGKERLNKIMKKAGGAVGSQQSDIDTLTKPRTSNKKNILENTTYSLQWDYY